jgi:hypothetical protein
MYVAAEPDVVGADGALQPVGVPVPVIVHNTVPVGGLAPVGPVTVSVYVAVAPGFDPPDPLNTASGETLTTVIVGTTAAGSAV